MIELTYEQKLAAINALGQAHVMMRKPGDWYVSQAGVEIKSGGLLKNVSGNGVNPGNAIENHWDKLTTLEDNEVVTLNAMRDSRRYVRWNGFMWVDVPFGFAEAAT
jgi:hypothetical protein